MGYIIALVADIVALVAFVLIGWLTVITCQWVIEIFVRIFSKIFR